MKGTAVLDMPSGRQAIMRAAAVVRIDSQGHVLSPVNWQENHLLSVPLPAPMRLEDAPNRTVTHIAFCDFGAVSLQAVLEQIHRNHPESYAHLLFSGAFNPRPKRGQANAFSLHSIGWAIDFNSSLYGFHPERVFHITEMLPWFQDVIRVFLAYGWKWGGDFGDPMHFQCGKGY